MSGTRRNLNSFSRRAAAFGCLTPAYPVKTVVDGERAEGRTFENAKPGRGDALKRQRGGQGVAAAAPRIPATLS